MMKMMMMMKDEDDIDVLDDDGCNVDGYDEG